MKKTAINIGIILAIVAATYFITKGFFVPDVVTKIHTDTVRVEKPYPVEVVKQGEKPETVKIYETKKDTITKVKVVKDTVYVSTKDEHTYEYDSNFLTNYTVAPKLLGIKETNDGRLHLTYFTTGGNTRTKIWLVRGKNYQVGLSPSGEPLINTTPKRNGLELEFRLGGGYLLGVEYGSPYIKAAVGVELFGVDVLTGVNINKHPFMTLGVEYAF